MPVSRSQRLKKAAAKAVKRKAVVAEKLAKERRDLRISKPRHVDLAASPIAACLVLTNIEEVGLGTVIVARKLSLGRYATATFLVDLWCLGVKDVFFRVDEADDFDGLRERIGESGVLVDIAPARARLLLRDAVAYGATNGFSPPADFAEIERMLGDFEPAGEPFTFGDQGRPHFVVGPYDSRHRIDYVQATLSEKFGINGFDVTYPLDDEEYDEPDMLEPPA